MGRTNTMRPFTPPQYVGANLFALGGMNSALKCVSAGEISVMVTGAMAIFTVKFWSVFLYVVMWVDQNLIWSMYPDVQTS